RKHDPCLTGCKLIAAGEVRELLWISFANRRIFIITMRLAGDDLPITVAPQPGVGNMITRAQLLAKSRLRLVSVVAKNSHVIVNPTLDAIEFDRAGISSWQRRDIRNQLGLIHSTSLFIRENG